MLRNELVNFLLLVEIATRDNNGEKNRAYRRRTKVKITRRRGATSKDREVTARERSPEIVGARDARSGN